MVKKCSAFRCFAALAMGGLMASCQGNPGFMAAPPGTSPTVELATSDSVPGSYLVMFRTARSQASLFFASFFDEYQYHYLSLADEFLADPRLRSLDVLHSADLSLQSDAAEWRADFDPPAAMQLFWNENPNDMASGVMAKVEFSSEESAREVLKQWELQGRIWYAEPNNISRLSADDEKTPWNSRGTLYKEIGQSWHANIHLIEAFNSIASSTSRISNAEIAANAPIIAVLDSGTDYEHPLLIENRWENSRPGESGCDNDLYGCNTTAPSKGRLGDGDVWPVGANGPDVAVDGKGSHGTHVAGIIAGKADKSSGVGGVCPVCRIMTVKVAEIEQGSASATPGISDDSQIRGLKYITRFSSANGSNAVRIVNSSFGKYTRSRSVAILVDALKKINSGTLVIAAASNEDSMIRSYPAALANAVAVASLDADNRKSHFSNFGPWVDVAAPGDQIISTVPGKSQQPDSGTSMASPVTAGAAGLFLALNPGVSFSELRNRILDCADATIYTGDSEGAKFNAMYYFPAISGEDVRRPLLGSGIVNVDNMITGNCKGSIGRPLDRVTPGCSSIAAQASGSSALAVAIWILPFCFGISRRRQ